MKKILFSLVLLLTFLSVGAQDINLGLVSHYPLSGNADDAVGGRDGVVTNATLTADRNGVADEAYYFDGNSSYITIADATGVFELQESGYSVSAWIYTEDPQTMSTGRILSYGGRENNGWQIHTYTWPHEVTAALCDETTTYYQTTTTISKGYWMHVAFVYESNVLKLYVNGVLEDTNTHAYSENTGNHPLVLGASSYNLEWGFAGAIDDVRLYNRSITHDEINLLADNTASFLSDFENQSLIPDGGSVTAETDLFGGGTVTVVANPDKDAVNGSDYVLKSTTLDNAVDYSRAEYSTQWSNTFKTAGYTHIYKWKVYFPSGYTDVDAIDYDWDVIAQFVTHPCANYDGDGGIYDHFGDEVCGTGGIFNEIRIDKDDFNQYGFTFRAEPDCDTIPWTFVEDEWVDIAMEIHYSVNFDGYYGIYINGNLLGGESAVRTLPASFITDGECDIRWKVGAYQNWTDAVKTERSYYIDDLELYIDKDLAAVCPECNVSSVIEISQSGTLGNPYVVDGSVYGDKVLVTGDYVRMINCTFNSELEIQGSYVEIDGNSVNGTLNVNKAVGFEFENNTVTGSGDIVTLLYPTSFLNRGGIVINNNDYTGVVNGFYNGMNWGSWRWSTGFDINSSF